MRKITLAVTASLDGFIARRDGSIDWIPPADDLAELAHVELTARVDTIIMGRRTWDMERDRAGGAPPFSGKRCVVFSRRRAGLRQGRTQFTEEDPETCVRRLRQSPARNGSGGIWLVGGGQIVRDCLDASIVDEVVLTLVPVLLGDGVPLFLPRGGTTWLKLFACRSFSNGRVLLRYEPVGARRRRLACEPRTATDGVVPSAPLSELVVG
jgi:dihydrofolate reductase